MIVTVDDSSYCGCVPCYPRDVCRARVIRFVCWFSNNTKSQSCKIALSHSLKSVQFEPPACLDLSSKILHHATTANVKNECIYGCLLIANNVVFCFFVYLWFVIVVDVVVIAAVLAVVVWGWECFCFLT